MQPSDDNTFVINPDMLAPANSMKEAKGFRQGLVKGSPKPVTVIKRYTTLEGVERELVVHPTKGYRDRRV